MELQKDERIEFSNYWNDDTHLITYTPKDMRFNMWSQNYTIALVNNQIVIKYPLPQTRNCFGIMTCPNKSMFIYVHNNYMNGEASIIIEIYHIIDDIINKLREFIIPSNHSCGNTEGVLQRVGTNQFNVAWGDFLNEDDISLFTFNLDVFSPTQIIKDFKMDDDLKNYYFITNDHILQSDVVASNNNKLDIYIINSKKETLLFIIQDVVLPYTHKYEHPDEVESSILEFGFYDKKTLCLIRIKLENKIDVLHLEEYSIDVLIDINANSIISISPKIKNNDIHSSIYFIKDEPMIW